MPIPQYVIFHAAGEGWNASLSMLEQQGVGDHAAYYFALQAEGRVERGGPFPALNGGMMVLAPDVSMVEAKSIAEGDPAFLSGLLTYDIRLWLQVIQ